MLTGRTSDRRKRECTAGSGVLEARMRPCEAAFIADGEKQKALQALRYMVCQMPTDVNDQFFDRHISRHTEQLPA